ncbi:MAG: SusC/RagA family TonB-linked outer membrane protein, partial [Mangrovibacterium sp.]
MNTKPQTHSPVLRILILLLLLYASGHEPAEAVIPALTQPGLSDEVTRPDSPGSTLNGGSIQQAIPTIRGKVTDAKGQPLPGVTIAIKGTATGTITDSDGNYTLTNLPESAVLVFSFVGMQTCEIPVDKPVINIRMEEETIGLEEVVAIGYGTQKKANLTGAVGSVQMDDLENRPLTNSGLALQGKVSGVYVLQNSGKPGEDGGTINIRGIGTLNNSDPLILIDGMPGDMEDVNSQDIESISVLKDASSAAIYGNRAANGVILVTTKRGSSKKANVTYNGYIGVQEATSLPDVLNSERYAILYNEAAVNSGRQPRYTENEIEKFATGDDPMYPDIDYFDVYYDEATIQNHRINISGGSENLQCAFMLGYLDQDGILVGTSYDKIDFRSNFDAFFLKDDKLKISARLSGNRGIRKEPQNEGSTKWYALNAPVWPLKNEDGEWIAVAGEDNFYARVKEGCTTKQTRYKFSGQLEAKYEILEGLSAEVSYGYNIVEANTNSFNSNMTLYTMDGVRKNLPSDLTDQNDHETQSLLTSLLRFEKKIGIHELNFLAGYSEEELEESWSSGYRQNFVNNTQRILNLGDAATMQNDAGAWDLGLRSVFGRVNYILKDRYLLEANIRYDGSSRFDEDERWGTFPSFSVGWILSEENFMKNIDWLNMLKLRGSWGELGNQNINSYYAASDILTMGQDYSFGGNLNSGVAVTSMSNKETTWETTRQTNIGLDLVFSKGINVTMDYFSRKTEDILVQIPIPLTMGDLTPPYSNVGEVKNKGFELTASYKKTFANGLKFSGALNLSHINNEITDLNGRSPILGIYGDQTAWVEGEAINSFYGYKVDGVYQISDFTWQDNSNPDIAHKSRNYILKDDLVSVSNFTAQPGDLKYKDLNGDG